jgi:hypothetical protein
MKRLFLVIAAIAASASLAGKAKTINLPGERSITTSSGLDATLTNLSNPSKTATLDITGAMHQSTTQTGDIATVATGAVSSATRLRAWS